MRPRLRTALALLGVAGTLCAVPAVADTGEAAVAPPKVLVFSGTYGFRHPVVTESNAVLASMGLTTKAYDATVTENPADITAANLRRYDVLVWNSATGKTPLTQQQRDDMIRWAYCGGGFVATHASADGNYGWAEFAELLGAQFNSHPHNEGGGPVRLDVESDALPVRAYADQGDSVTVDEELYRWRRDPRGTADTEVLLSLDASTLAPAIQRDPSVAYDEAQPVAWTKTFRGGGRTFYTNLGHGNRSWDDPVFRASMVDGIRWASGVRPDPTCLDSDAPLPPAPGPEAPQPGRAPLEPCTLPTRGPGGAPRTGVVWQNNGPALALTPAGDTRTLAPGLVGGLAWGAQTYVVDLSGSGARTADVRLDLAWPVPSDDYDLSVTTPWGWSASNRYPLVGAAGERVVLEDVPHCTRLDVHAENAYAVSGRAPVLTAAVTPGAPTAPAAHPLSSRRNP